MKKIIAAALIAVLFVFSAVAEISNHTTWGYETEPSDAVYAKLEEILDNMTGGTTIGLNVYTHDDDTEFWYTKNGKTVNYARYGWAKANSADGYYIRLKTDDLAPSPAELATPTEVVCVTESDEIRAIVKWVRNNFMYATAKIAMEGGVSKWIANRMVDGLYIPDVDKFVTSGKCNSGICLDYAVTCMSLLRANGIDASIAVGQAHNAYHAVTVFNYAGYTYQIDFQKSGAPIELFDSSVYTIIAD